MSDLVYVYYIQCLNKNLTMSEEGYEFQFAHINYCTNRYFRSRYIIIILINTEFVP